MFHYSFSNGRHSCVMSKFLITARFYRSSYLLLNFYLGSKFITGSSKHRASAFACGVTAGAIALVRPEAGLLGLLLVGTSKYAHRSRRDVIRFSVPWLIGSFGLLACNVITTGSLFPSTLRGRSWMWFRAEHGAHSIHSIGGFFGQWIRRLPQLFSLQFAAIQIRLTRADWFYSATAVLLATLFMIGAVIIYRQAGMRMKLLLLWVALHTTTYLVLFPASGHGGRYQPGILLFAFPFIFSAVLLLLRTMLPGRLVTQHTLIIVIAVCSGASSLYTWRTVSILGIAHIKATHGAMAELVKRNLPSNISVAAFDVGDISYILNRPITDLGGLMDSNYIPYLETNTVPVYLQHNGIIYVVLPKSEKEKDDLHLLQTQGKQLLASFCSALEPWRIAYSFTASSWRCQELYRLNFPRLP